MLFELDHGAFVVDRADVIEKRGVPGRRDVQLVCQANQRRQIRKTNRASVRSSQFRRIDRLIEQVRFSMPAGYLNDCVKVGFGRNLEEIRVFLDKQDS